MAQNDVAPSADPGTLIESVITKGDLARLSPQERTQYYVRTCETLGLNPFTKPFEYITLNGQLRLYARREAADQLRKINGISVEVVSRKVEDDLIVVHVRASDKTGRKDEDFGAVSVASLRGEAKANAILKAITKAKRRVTLSIAGLGFLDETEVDDIPIKEKAAPSISAADDLDKFAVNLAADALTKGPSEAPLATPKPPQMAMRRSAIWHDGNYRIATKQLLDETPDWNQWATEMEYLISEASNAELDKLLIDNKDLLNELRRTRGDRYRDITIAGAARRDELRTEDTTNDTARC